MEPVRITFELGEVHYTVYRFNEGATQTAPLIYLHGFGGTGALFDSFASRFQRTVYAIDLLGHGSSSSPLNPERYALDKQLHDLGSIITALSHEAHSAHLLGYSMGGRLAMRLALQYPALFQSLTIESSSPGILSEEDREDRRKRDARLAESLLSDMGSFFAAWNRLPLFASPTDAPAALRRRFEQAQLHNNPSGLANSLIGFGAGTLPPIHEELKDLRMPFTIITGSLDKAYTDMWHTLIGQLPAARSVIIDGAGHRVHLDRPDAYIQHIQHFLHQTENNS